MHVIEHAFSCPYCAAPITVVLDPSVPAQRYVEDCEVCCNPIELAYAVEGDEVVAFEARSIEQ
ncbi:MAG: CPXCG motif-containing cysteine-rich protein [Rubricoccaceae bacterium]|nr:CPXCG motif-containing cysteine-rich protein [Rubricoccaceae bacterium]